MILHESSEQSTSSNHRFASGLQFCGSVIGAAAPFSTVLLSLTAGVLAKRRSGWTQGEAATATAMVFVISARLGMGN